MAPQAGVSASLGPLGPLLKKLDALHAGEYGRMRGVRTMIGSLRSELTSMYAAGKDYTMLEEPDSEVKTWISLLRELAYDTDDCIDKFIRQIGSGGRRGGFKDFFRKAARHLTTLRSLRGIADQIDLLKGRAKQMKDLKIDKNSSQVDPRLSALFAEEAHLVGIDGPRDDLSKWIVEKENKHPKVLSIVGFGGLGKTTLANEVCRKIQENFDCRVFVSVSQKPDTKKILQDAISQVTHLDRSTRYTGDWDEQKSLQMLRELLQDKRYLIIIDDIWSIAAWNAIKYAFPENNCCSRVIVTTRVIDVAKSCCTGGDDRLYQMGHLSEIESRVLFCRRIFGSDYRCPDILNEVLHKILRSCGGLPLAIISISGLLASKPAIKEEWEKVERSIRSALDENRSLEGISGILSLSYNDLAPHLKTCLLYLSIFPEDYVIERERLVKLWIAEGFISAKHGQSRQEVAESYFYELVNRSMILPVDIGYDGRPRACRVHDMVFGLIISKSLEDNFTTLVGAGLSGFANHHRFIRRLSVQQIDQELASALANEDLSHVRSLIVTSAGCIKLLPSLLKFGALRILDFEDCEGLEEYIMNGMDKLFGLKYLRLSGKAISKLPSGTSMLGGLETLDLRNTSVLELPAGIVQLTKLEHLHGAGQTKMPNGVGDMRNLRVISGFNIQISGDVVEELGNLVSLDELKVSLTTRGFDNYTRHEELLLSLLCKLGTGKLRSLWIHKCHGSLEFLDSWSPLPSSLKIFCTSGDYCFTNIPKWISPALTSLVHLEISLIELRGGGLHTLGELPGLLYLKLSFVADPVEMITVKGNGFPNLKNFVIYSVAGSYFTFMEGAMQNLEKLVMKLHLSLAKNNGFYLGIQHLPCLKEVAVSLYEVDVTRYEIKAAAAAIRKEAFVHPYHPTINIYGEFYEKHNEEILSDEEDLR